VAQGGGATSLTRRTPRHPEHEAYRRTVGHRPGQDRRDRPVAGRGEHTGHVAVRSDVIQRGDRRWHEGQLAGSEPCEGVTRAQPGHLVRLPAHRARPLAGGHRGHEEARVVPPLLELRGDPVRPRRDQVGAQQEASLDQQVAEGQRPGHQRLALALVAVLQGVRDDLGRVGPGEQHSGLLERLTQRRADQGTHQATGAERRSAHACGGGPAQGTSASPSRRSTTPPGKTYIPAAKAIEATRRMR
jgi:hypothetical protein